MSALGRTQTFVLDVRNGSNSDVEPECPERVESRHFVGHSGPVATASEGKPVFRVAFGRVHISGWPAVLLVPVVLPIFLLIAFAERLFGLKTSKDRTAGEVEAYLRDFLDGTGGAWDWDDFTSIEITDPELDAIREAAAWVELPLTEGGRATLNDLLQQVRAM